MLGIGVVNFARGALFLKGANVFIGLICFRRNGILRSRRRYGRFGKELTSTCIVARVCGLYPQHTLRSRGAADDFVKGREGVTGIILAGGVIVAIWLGIKIESARDFEFLAGSGNVIDRSRLKDANGI